MPPTYLMLAAVWAASLAVQEVGNLGGELDVM
jgi:hypothetical protein